MRPGQPQSKIQKMEREEDEGFARFFFGYLVPKLGCSIISVFSFFFFPSLLSLLNRVILFVGGLTTSHVLLFDKQAD